MADSCTVSLSPIAGCDRVTVSRFKHALQTSSFVPILGFGSRVSLALVCFFWPDCEFLVVIVHLVLLSRCSVRDFSSGLFLQLHLVVVYSVVAVGRHSSTAVLYSATALSLVRRQCGSLPQLGLLTPRKLSGMLCHCVVLDPSVSLFSWSTPTAWSNTTV